MINIKIHKLARNIDGSFMWLESELFDDTDIRNNLGTLPKWVCSSQAFVELFLPYKNDDETVDIKRLENDIKRGKIVDILHIDNMFRTIVQIGDKCVPVVLKKREGQWVDDPRSVARMLIDRGYLESFMNTEYNLSL